MAWLTPFWSLICPNCYGVLHTQRTKALEWNQGKSCSFLSESAPMQTLLCYWSILLEKREPMGRCHTTSCHRRRYSGIHLVSSLWLWHWLSWKSCPIRLGNVLNKGPRRRGTGWVCGGMIMMIQFVCNILFCCFKVGVVFYSHALGSGIHEIWTLIVHEPCRYTLKPACIIVVHV